MGIALGELPTALFGLLAAAGFGGFYIAMDAASETNIPWALLIARLTSVTIIVAAGFRKRTTFAPRRADLPGLALIGCSSSVLSSLHPLITIGLARVHLHEHLERIQQIGITCCVIGVAAVSIA